jgi:hypothetical protein
LRRLRLRDDIDDPLPDLSIFHLVWNQLVPIKSDPNVLMNRLPAPLRNEGAGLVNEITQKGEYIECKSFVLILPFPFIEVYT